VEISLSGNEWMGIFFVSEGQNGGKAHIREIVKYKLHP